LQNIQGEATKGKKRLVTHSSAQPAVAKLSFFLPGSAFFWTSKKEGGQKTL
jgi:hypothetical protein